MSTETFTPLDIPAFGMPVKAGGCAGDCGCGGGCSCSGDCGGGCGGSCGAGAFDGTPLLALPPEDGTEAPWTSAPSGTRPVYAAAGGTDALDQALATIDHVRQAAWAPLRAQEGGGPTELVELGGFVKFRVMTNTGNLRVQFRPPAAGPADPRPLFTYNSDGSSGGEFGNGWNNSFKRSVTEVDATSATVNAGTGQSFAYTSKDAGTGYYTPPGTAKNALQKDSGGWTETQPDGTAFRYDTTGKLQYVKNPAGARWSLTYSAGLIRRITNPFNRLTSFAYDF